MNGARGRALGAAFACMQFACMQSACMLFAGAAAAQAAAPDPSATPQPSASVRDPDFGVIAHHFGLERDVEMFQWRRRGDAYERDWSGDALDSSGFAPGHDNPPFPLPGQRWIAKEVRVGDVPLDPAALQALGEWIAFRPSFNALPGNLAATFQPQGDGLGTAEDPMDPQVGDLRIHWRELRLPPLRDRIELRGGAWRLKAAPVAGAAAAGGDAARRDGPKAGERPVTWLAAAFVLVFLAAFGAARVLRRRR